MAGSGLVQSALTGTMSSDQIKNANTILDVATSHVYPRPVAVMAIMCAIQESTLTNLGQPFPGDYNFLSVDPNKNPWDAGAKKGGTVPDYSGLPNKPYADSKRRRLP